mmetsp:Transcript_24176/g.55610  ORF Transcript_24176/g.55610 Transcript_24176/m.55610 type:complete len:676 (+) Transcript_24176:252-2279(+)
MSRKTVVIAVCDSDELASQAFENLGAHFAATRIDTTRYETVGEAFTDAKLGIEDPGTPMVVVDAPLEKVEYLLTRTHEQQAAVDQLVNEQKETIAQLRKDLAAAEAKNTNWKSKYQDLYRYCKKVEDELLNVFYKWLPSKVPMFERMQTMRQVEEHEEGTVDNIGPYTMSLDTLIRKGNFGKIFYTQLNDGRNVVVKHVPKARMMTIKSMTRMAQQLKVLLEPVPTERHTNILYLEQALQSTRSMFLVMPQYGRCDVFDFVGSCSPDDFTGVGEAVAMAVIKPVLSALSHLHARGIAHRDVKSENILVDYRKDEITGAVTVNGVKLIDFDLCCRVGQVGPKDMAGSLGFISPEAMTMMNNVTDQTTTDVWASACVLMELVMGRDWFSEYWLNIYREFPKIEAAHRRAAQLDFESRLDKGAKRVCRACKTAPTEFVLANSMHIEPTERYTAAELLRHLDQLERPGLPGPYTQSQMRFGPAEEEEDLSSVQGEVGDSVSGSLSGSESGRLESQLQPHRHGPSVRFELDERPNTADDIDSVSSRTTAGAVHSGGHRSRSASTEGKGAKGKGAAADAGAASEPDQPQHEHPGPDASPASPFRKLGESPAPPAAILTAAAEEAMSEAAKVMRAAMASDDSSNNLVSAAMAIIKPERRPRSNRLIAPGEGSQVAKRYAACD